MTLGETLQAILVVAAGASCACSLYVAYRASAWRKGGQAKELIETIARAQRTAEMWHDSDAARRLLDRVDVAERRLDITETRMAALPTREDLGKLSGDLANLAGELHGATRLLNAVGAAVSRIEGFMMERT